MAWPGELLLMIGRRKHIGRHDATVPRDDSARLVHQDRISPAPLLDAGSYLANLRVRMRAGVASVWHQRLDGAALDLVGRPHHI